MKGKFFGFIAGIIKIIFGGLGVVICSAIFFIVWGFKDIWWKAPSSTDGRIDIK